MVLAYIPRLKQPYCIYLSSRGTVAVYLRPGQRASYFVTVGGHLETRNPPYKDKEIVMSEVLSQRRADSKLARLAVLMVGAFVWGLAPARLMAAASYIQSNYTTPQSSVSTVTVNYSAAETAGDLNVVVVGWNDATATVQQVKDSAGNVYSLATGPTSGTALRQAIYYAPNILGGSNTVTVTFSQAAAFPDVRVLEYRGVNVLDVTAGASGSSATANSGAATTHVASELIFGAAMVATSVKAAGSGFTSRVITAPDGDIAEDKVVTVTGSNSATATLSSSGPWVMQMVAFSAASGPAPTVTGVSPNSGPTTGGTAVTITGTNFATGATVTFGGTAASNVVVTNSTAITAITPAGSAGGATVAVSVSGQSGSLTNGFTYIAAPTVTSVSPNNGPAAGGTAVTITGTSFASGATVTFGGTAATNVIVTNSTTITASTPAGAAGSVPVTVTVNGQSGSLSNGFSYVVPPTVTNVSPNHGSTGGGTAVTITGTNFATGATVTFGTTAATNVVVTNSTTITATTPAGTAGAVTVTVTNPGAQSGNLTSGFTYVVVPTVTSVTPNNGSVAGGTVVTISGTNFAASATVTFGGTAATNVVVTNSTTITATTPGGAAGAVSVTVTVNGQSGSLANGFTYGTVTISFVQVAAATPQSSAATVSLAYPGAQTAGDLNIVVVGWNDTSATVQQVKDSGGNTYSLAIGPTSGTALRQSIYYAPNIVGGSNTVTVTFNQAAAFPDVRILEYRGVNTVDVTAGASGNSAAANSGAATTTLANELIFGANTVATGNAAPGSGFTSRIITSPDGDLTEDKMVTATGSNSATATLASSGAWVMQMVTFAAAFGPPPTVTSVSPTTGTTAGGTTVTITGTNFAPGATVTFGGVAAPNVAVASSTQLTATTPSGSAGTVTVTVTVSGQSGSLASAFTYVPVPTVTSVSPRGGPTTGGTTVTITGANFAAGATVTFGPAPATNVVVANGTQITATTPAGSAGPVTVTVAVNGQSGSLLNAFTYTLPPTVTGVSPNTGPTSGGTAITIAGTNFATGATVTLGSLPAANVVVVSSTQITASTPAQSASTVNVTVTNLGPQSATLPNAFTYAASTPTMPTGLAAAPGGPGPTYISGQGYYNSTSLTSHTTAIFDSTGGDLIVLFASSHAGVTFTPSDNFGNTWISIAGPTSTTAGYDLRSQIWYAPNPTVGAGQTLTMNLSIAQPLVMSIAVLKGSNLSSPIDAISLIGSDNGTSSVNVTSPGVTTSSLNDLLVGFVKTNGTETFTAGPGFTLQPTSTVLNLTAETETAPTSAAYTATFTLSQGVTWQSVLAAVMNNPNQMNLSWNPSTETGGTISNYLVERCQGTGCSNFAQVGTTTTTTFNDTGLTASSSYSYRVRAQDAAGTLGPYSTVYTATSPAPLPSLPGNLVAAGASSTQANLSWSASTEIGGTVNNYIVERCQGAGCTTFAQIGTSTTTTFGDTGLTAGTTYNYRVRASDTTGGLSPYSNVSTAITTGAPTDPTNLVATAVSPTQINLTWTASTETGGTVTGYLIERCQGVGCSNFARLLTVPTNSYSDTGLTSGSSYTYHVKATDASGNFSNYSNLATAVTPAQGTTISYVQGTDTTPQSAPATVTVTFGGAQTLSDLNVVVVGWNNSTATVTSVTDTSGNAYALAVGPTVINGVESQSIYYAKNIAAAPAGINTVTVTFSSPAAYPDIRILEYAGADPANPVDVTAAASGNSATSSSGAVTTTYPTDLLFAANMVQTATSGPGGGFTTRLLTSPDGDIAEDQMVSTVGSYNAAAPLSTGQWIMQLVAFRSVSVSGPVANLSTTSINFGNQSTGASSNPQPITLTNVGTAQLSINSIGISGGNTGDFAQTNNCPASLAINGSCTINVTFTPSNTGTRSSQVVVSDNASGGTQTVFLTGTGTGYSVSPSVAVLTFSRTQQFMASGSPTWSVDGIAGGSAAVGTVTATGVYTPPAATGTHTVTAATQTQSASATVFITNYPGVFTYHYDNLRTGQNTNEAVLTPANVNATQFGKLYAYSTDGLSYASPLYVANVNISGQGFHNVAYVVTEHDSVYAFDADGLSNSPLWHVSFLKSGVTSVPCADTGECGDIPTEIGITSTPAIDQTTGTLYVVAATKESGSYVQRLHALDITSGAEKFGGPVVIQASVSGTGDGAAGGAVAFDPLRENQRPGLLLSNGVVYLAFGSHGDQHPWHGWLLAYNASTLARVMVYNVTPNGFGGGIWQSGGGINADASGNIYFTSSNGTFDLNTGGADAADTIEKISTAGVLIDYFTPHDQAAMETNNVELGSAGPVLLIDQPTGSFPHLLVSAGKEGTIYVINRDNMGHYNPNNDNAAVQVLTGLLNTDGTQDGGNFSVPIYFNGYLYFGAVNDRLKAFQMTNGLLGTTPVSQSSVTYPNRGGSFSVSANGASNGIVWATEDDSPSPGVLHAYNATNLANELYNSNMAPGARDSLGLTAKFVIPTVANGRVYVVTQGQLLVYGLLP